jgi:hypothetical protein
LTANPDTAVAKLQQANAGRKLIVDIETISGMFAAQSHHYCTPTILGRDY